VAPQRRVVFLGASNLARGISVIVDRSRQFWGQPLEVIAALGHGRSYGRDSSVLGRRLPGIIQCDLWDDLAIRSQVPTAAVVTDVGNDLLYGAEVEQVAFWLRGCLDRLAPRCQRLVITALPLSSLSRLGRSRFLFLRTLLFPQSRLTLDRAWRAAQELNEQVVRLSLEYRATLVVPRGEWFGLDPIHIRSAMSQAAWQEILSPWHEDTEAVVARSEIVPGSITQWMRLRCTRPRRRTLFGINQQQAQPATMLPDGTTISFY
jgi:hypothetical protein